METVKFSSRVIRLDSTQKNKLSIIIILLIKNKQVEPIKYFQTKYLNFKWVRKLFLTVQTAQTEQQIWINWIQLIKINHLFNRKL